MNRSWQPLARDAKKAVTLALYAKNTGPGAILAGEAPILDLTPYASRMDQTHDQLTFTLSWHLELSGALMCVPGQWVLVRLNGQPLCVQRIDAITDYRIASGVRQCGVTCRARDASDKWRDLQLATRTYAIGAPAIEIVTDVARAMGLRDGELAVIQLNTQVPRSGVQFAAVSAWTVLEQVLLPAGLCPVVDALGRLTAYSRDVLREADVVLGDDRVEAFGGSRSQMAITRLTLRWRAPRMQMLLQTERAMGSATLLAGIFKLRHVHRVWYSEDHTARAVNERLVIKQSVNRLVPVAKEYLEDTTLEWTKERCAAIVLHTYTWIPTWIGGYAATIIGASFVPDGVAYGVTIPFGRMIAMANAVWGMVMLISFGEGHYEVRAQPLDSVAVENTTAAYDENASPGASRREVIENDFVSSEGAATALVVREFIYRARAATQFTLTIVDDPGIEVGDIVQLGDGLRIFVTGYHRDLSIGTSHLLELEGFAA